MGEGRDWGLDPAVRETREVFALMEKGQWELLESVGISPFEPRLRRWREQARAVFERAGADLARAGRAWAAPEAAGAYVHALARILSAAGIPVPVVALPAGEERP